MSARPIVHRRGCVCGCVFINCLFKWNCFWTDKSREMFSRSRFSAHLRMSRRWWWRGVGKKQVPGHGDPSTVGHSASFTSQTQQQEQQQNVIINIGEESEEWNPPPQQQQQHLIMETLNLIYIFYIQRSSPAYGHSAGCCGVMLAVAGGDFNKIFFWCHRSEKGE